MTKEFSCLECGTDQANANDYINTLEEEIAEIRLMLANERAENQKLVEIIIKIGKERAEQSKCPTNAG